MENSRLSVVIPDYQLAQTAIKVLNNELVENNVGGDRKDIYLRQKITVATKSLKTLLKGWKSERVVVKATPQVGVSIAIDKVKIINITLQMLKKKSNQERTEDHYYLRSLATAYDALSEVMVDLWNEPLIHENTITVIT